MRIKTVVAGLTFGGTTVIAAAMFGSALTSPETSARTGRQLEPSPLAAQAFPPKLSPPAGLPAQVEQGVTAVLARSLDGSTLNEISALAPATEEASASLNGSQQGILDSWKVMSNTLAGTRTGVMQNVPPSASFATYLATSNTQGSMKANTPAMAFAQAAAEAFAMEASSSQNGSATPGSVQPVPANESVLAVEEQAFRPSDAAMPGKPIGIEDAYRRILLDEMLTDGLIKEELTRNVAAPDVRLPASSNEVPEPGMAATFLAGLFAMAMLCGARRYRAR